MEKLNLTELRTLDDDEFIKLKAVKYATRTELTSTLRFSDRNLTEVKDPRTKGQVCYAIRRIENMYFYLSRDQTYILKSTIKTASWDKLLAED